MFFQIVEIIYWLALSAWFGGVLFLAIAWPVIVRTLRERDPILPDVLSVNLTGQHGTVLAGEIIDRLQQALVPIELGCAIAIFLAMIAQVFVVERDVFTLVLRSMLYIGAVIFLLYDWRGTWPKIRHHRQEFLDHADEPEIANPARDQLDHFHHQSINALTILFLMLLGLILFSGHLAPAGRAISSIVAQ